MKQLEFNFYTLYSALPKRADNQIQVSSATKLAARSMIRRGIQILDRIPFLYGIQIVFIPSFPHQHDILHRALQDRNSTQKLIETFYSSDLIAALTNPQKPIGEWSVLTIPQYPYRIIIASEHPNKWMSDVVYKNNYIEKYILITSEL